MYYLKHQEEKRAKISGLLLGLGEIKQKNREVRQRIPQATGGEKEDIGRAVIRLGTGAKERMREQQAFIANSGEVLPATLRIVETLDGSVDVEEVRLQKDVLGVSCDDRTTVVQLAERAGFRLTGAIRC